ncbi:hypothetical protein [Streptomyces sp. NPDC086010]|uniref:hypothetical protein n=1 Tax=Streptomyces sp. NPDC086010 TaxID=3365745 RepID=UPI0037D0CE58
MNVGEQWADAALADLLALGPAWRGLLAHAATARSTRPSAAWERRARERLDWIGASGVRERVLPWLAVVGQPRSLPRQQEDPTTGPVDELLDPCNANALNGVAARGRGRGPHPLRGPR